MRFNLRLSLDDVISDDEQKILENIKYCSRLVGKSFKVVFWNRDISESETKEFIKRNEEILFDLNTKITKKTLINGIASYIKIVKRLTRIENENKS